jgi:CRISPR-associated protein (TIGR03986 family)
MYFRIRTDAAGRGRPTYEDRHIAKSALTLPDCIPKGRKVYLHHKIGLFRATHQSAQDYLRTQRQNPPPDKQQMNVRPIKAGVGFEFSIRFDNLDEWELGCLLYVLKPTATYNHKVGLGKPVGMGSVDIAIAKVETINRGKKYSWQGWSAAAHYTTSLDAQSQRTMRASFRTTINLRTRTMLEAVGEPDRVTCRVMYPRAQNQLNNQGMPNTEDELFGWFVNNDDLFMRQRQALGTDLLYNNMPSFVPNQKPERPQHH